MKNARPNMEEMDGKVVYFPPESACLTLMYKVLFPICTLTCRVNKYVSRQGESIKRRKESAENTSLLLLCSTDDNTQYC